MVCVICGKDMSCKIGRYHYKECGLDDVYLCNVKICTCRGCREQIVCIPAMPELHTVIAESLLEKTSRLDGKEIRFLRKNIGLKSTQLSGYLQVNIATISRWEHGEQRISLPHDLLLRLVYANIKGLPTESTRRMIEDRFAQITKTDSVSSPVCIDINELSHTPLLSP